MSFKNFAEVGKKYGVASGGDWMNLQVGDNKVRIVSDFKDYGTHYNPKTNKSVVCVGHGQCSLCAVGDEPRVQFLGWVIDRADGKLKLLRIGYRVYEQLGKLALNEEYAFEDTPSYDVTINRTGEGKSTKYAVVPARKNTELTQAEKVLIGENMKEPDEIIQKMKDKVVVGSGNIPVVEDEPGEPETEMGDEPPITEE